MAVLGIDIGGSGIKGAPVDTLSGELLAERIRLETPPDAKPEDCAVVVAEIAKAFNWQDAIGVGFPAIIKKGVALSAANVDAGWINTDVSALLEAHTHCKVSVVNDADAAGLAEMRFGIGKNLQEDVILFLTIGTGIGSAFFVNGQLMPNTELGHLQVRGKDAEKRASDATRKEKDLSWQDWGNNLNEVLSVYESLFNPDVIIIGGGISKKFEKFAEYLKLSAQVYPAQLQNMAGIIGAAMAVVP